MFQDNPYFLIAGFLIVATIVGYATRALIGEPTSVFEQVKKRPLGIDRRVTLGDQGFTFHDDTVPLDYEVTYRVKFYGRAPEKRMFLTTAHKVWVHTQEKPLGVEIVSIFRPAEEDARGTLAAVPQARRVGGHVSRIPKLRAPEMDKQEDKLDNLLVEPPPLAEERLTPVEEVAMSARTREER